MNLTQQQTFAIDIGERALNAAWQGAAGAAIPVVVAANTTDLAHLAWWQQLGAVAVAGAASAVLSLAKGVIAGVKTGTASLSNTVAQTAVLPGAHAADSAEVVTVDDPPAPSAAATAVDQALAAAAEVHPLDDTTPTSTLTEAPASA